MLIQIKVQLVIYLGFTRGIHNLLTVWINYEDSNIITVSAFTHEINCVVLFAVWLHYYIELGHGSCITRVTLLELVDRFFFSSLICDQPLWISFLPD